VIRWAAPNVGFGMRLTAFVAMVSVAGCIDVGHSAEIGCLVDMTEPGCMPRASAIDAGHDSAMRFDAARGDGAPESDSAPSSEPDADAGASPVSDGPTDASSDAPMTDAAGDGSSGD
jgi:hypothetical protein